MKAEAGEAAVCGVWLEFVDAEGNTLGSHVIDDWQGRPIPERGKLVRRREGSDLTQGIIVGKHFDLQHTADGRPRLWVHLLVRVVTPTARLRQAAFSLN